MSPLKKDQLLTTDELRNFYIRETTREHTHSLFLKNLSEGEGEGEEVDHDDDDNDNDHKVDLEELEPIILHKARPSTWTLNNGKWHTFWVF